MVTLWSIAVYAYPRIAIILIVAPNPMYWYSNMALKNIDIATGMNDHEPVSKAKMINGSKSKVMVHT